MRHPGCRKLRASAAAFLSAAALSSVMTATSARADITVVPPTQANTISWTLLTVGGKKYNVNLIALTDVASADQAVQDALKAQFPSWTFTYSDADALDGNLIVNRYLASASSPFGGGLLDATYVVGNGDPVVANLRWIQLVTTNAPLNGAVSPYIDPVPNDDTLPFYWTTPEDTSNANVATSCGNYAEGSKTDTRYHFGDCSTRNMSIFNAPVTWSGELVLASWTDPGGNKWINASPPIASQNVTVYGGIQWGWRITAAPEPGTWALILIGFAGLGVAGLKRQWSEKRA